MNIDDLKGLDEATRKEIEDLQKLTREKDGDESFAGAQYIVGKILHENDYIEEALNVWQGINLDDEPEIYANALFEIGKCVLPRENLKIEDLDKPIKIWEKIKRIYSLETYARAQHAIILMHFWKGDFRNALLTLENISYTDCPTTFARANYFLGTELIKKNPFAEAHIASSLFVKATELFPYESSCYRKICDLSLKDETRIIGQFCLQLFEKILDVVDVLKIDFGNALIDKKAPERKLAHYTSMHTTNLLLAVDITNNQKSPFRLNTINNVNDPSEGQLLINYLEDVKKPSSYVLNSDKELHSFISCFTFNNDSLNQFRLYGKQDNKEASGISLVLRKSFFQEAGSKDGLPFLTITDDLQYLEKKLVRESLSGSIKEDIEVKKKEKITKQPVMRCIYLDPTSGYLQLAQRNRLTFFREFGKDTVEIDHNDVLEEKIKAEVEWEKYKDAIDQKTEVVNEAFVYLKSKYKEITQRSIKIKQSDPKVFDEIKTLLDEIILPLKYLIKHSAFQEEQECRMIYIASLDSPKVQMEFGKFLYVDYEADVKAHLDKVYIAPAATQYQPYLAKLLCNTNVKIELSNNPYRQT